MLAVAGGGQNIESIRILISLKADTNVVDAQGNTILHIAAIYQNNEALDFLLNTNKSLNVFERNLKGETPLSIA